MPSLTVVGSLNMDFVVRVDKLPASGETVTGSRFQTIPGGKGANQANAAARLARPPLTVRMAGCVGQDANGDLLRASLAASGADIGGIRTAKAEPTGIAMIWVDREGRNSIVVAPGANHALTPVHVGPMRPAFSDSRYVLFQLETPLDTVAKAMRLAAECGAQCILDPAPAVPLSQDILQAAAILTPNETEAAALLGARTGPSSPDDARDMAAALIAMGPRAVILKLGEAGCYYYDGIEAIHSPGFAVGAVDTTAAGDTFNGALAVALSEGAPMAHALRFANAAAAVSVTRAGAQSSAPSRHEADAMAAEL